MANREVEGPMEIALVGDLSENQTSLCEKLLEVESGGECVLYIDSLGGSPYVAMAITTLILIRDLHNRHRGRRVLVGRSVALRRLRKAFGHALQRPSFPPHEVAERGERGPGRGHGMGPGISTNSRATWITCWPTCSVCRTKKSTPGATPAATFRAGISPKRDLRN